jgi:uncharacterized protein YggE
MYNLKYVLTIITLSALSIFAQSNETIFTAQVRSSVEAPADKISIRVNITLRNADPESLLKQHTEKENRLLALLEELNIPDSTIRFSLLSVRKAKSKKDELIVESKQTVVFAVTDFSKYFDVQIGLLNIGIHSIHPVFSTTHFEDTKKRGVKNALEMAREEAELYADNLNMKINRVVEIESNVRDDYPYGGPYGSVQSGTTKSLLEIPQQISVLTLVKVKYALVGK